MDILAPVADVVEGGDDETTTLYAFMVYAWQAFCGHPSTLSRKYKESCVANTFEPNNFLAGGPSDMDSLTRAATASSAQSGSMAPSMFVSSMLMNQQPHMPSMVGTMGTFLLPPMIPEDRNKFTIVLDLDETLIYGRAGPLLVRPYLKELLSFLGQHCEVVVWTAGVRKYAQDILRKIDPNRVIRHCVYRHRKWFPEDTHLYTKDLRLIGRDIAKTLILDNTPDCVVRNPENAIICSDFLPLQREDNRPGLGSGEDYTLLAFRDLVKELVRSKPASMSDFIRTHPNLISTFTATMHQESKAMYFMNLAKYQGGGSGSNVGTGAISNASMVSQSTHTNYDLEAIVRSTTTTPYTSRNDLGRRED